LNYTVTLTIRNYIHRVVYEFLARLPDETLDIEALSEHLSQELCSIPRFSVTRQGATLTVNDTTGSFTVHLVEDSKGLRLQPVPHRLVCQVSGFRGSSDRVLYCPSNPKGPKLRALKEDLSLFRDRLAGIHDDELLDRKVCSTVTKLFRGKGSDRWLLCGSHKNSKILDQELKASAVQTYLEDLGVPDAQVVLEGRFLTVTFNGSLASHYSYAFLFVPDGQHIDDRTVEGLFLSSCKKKFIIANTTPSSECLYTIQGIQEVYSRPSGLGILSPFYPLDRRMLKSQQSLCSPIEDEDISL
jgi:hypothetical protein